MSQFNLNRFWATAIHVNSVHIALESYLNHAPRFFAFHPDHPDLSNQQMKRVVSDIHILVFKVFLRLATNLDSKLDHMSPAYYSNLMHSKYLFDIPKLIDLCTVYGNSSDAMKAQLRQLIATVYSSSPKFANDLNAAISGYVHIFENVIEVLDVESGSNSRLKSLPWSQLNNTVYVIADMAVSLSNFVELFPTDAAKMSHELNMEHVIASFYDQVFVPLQAELEVRFVSLMDLQL